MRNKTIKHTKIVVLLKSLKPFGQRISANALKTCLGMTFFKFIWLEKFYRYVNHISNLWRDFVTLAGCLLELLLGLSVIKKKTVLWIHMLLLVSVIFSPFQEDLNALDSCRYIWRGRVGGFKAVLSTEQKILSRQLLQIFPSNNISGNMGMCTQNWEQEYCW